MRKISLAIVTYYPECESLNRMIDNVVEEACALNYQARIFIWDNTPDDYLERENLYKNAMVCASGCNIGFGAGVNRLINQISDEELWLVLNQDATLTPGALTKALRIYENSSNDVAVFEFCQTPCEHPKKYDPVTLNTDWFSGAAFLVRGEVFRQVGGFDEKLFMYSEDVDLSFRLRASGYCLLYMPGCLVEHNLFSDDGKPKVAQLIYDRANNILLRARYGGIASAATGLAIFIMDSIIRRVIKREKSYFFISFFHFLKNFKYFLKNNKIYRKYKFAKGFHFWRYVDHRYGCVDVKREKLSSKCLVSVIIRTVGRNHLLYEAIKSVLNQTYSYFEIIIIDDGDGRAREVLEAINNYEKIKYYYAGGVGRSKAGNLGLQKSTGEFIGFLDEDDLLFSDHIETLLGAILKSESIKVACSLAEEVRVSSDSRAYESYSEKSYRIPYKGSFSRVLLWYQNYIPIQSVLFHRSLYEQNGGFDETIDYYEDWSLWVKYSTLTDFKFVKKVTSRYKVPDPIKFRMARKINFMIASELVMNKHNYNNFMISPVKFRSMVREYMDLRVIFYISKDVLKSFRNKFVKIIKMNFPQLL